MNIKIPASKDGDGEGKSIQAPGRNPQYSPIFMSPGGSFKKHEKLNLLSPQASRAMLETADNADRLTGSLAGLGLGESSSRGGSKSPVGTLETSVFDTKRNTQAQVSADSDSSTATKGNEKAKMKTMTKTVGETESNSVPELSVSEMSESKMSVDNGAAAPPTEKAATAAKSKSKSVQPSQPEEGVSWGIKDGDVVHLGLFGGAITVDLPSAFEDMSSLRQVPDHQEVFVHKESDISVIVELLCNEPDQSAVEALDYHFSDLAECNEAESKEVLKKQVIKIPQFLPSLKSPRGKEQYCKAVLVGRQSVKKFRSPDAPLDSVLILLLCLRLPGVGTDVLVTINTPVDASDSLSGAIGNDICLEDIVPPYKSRTEDEGKALPYAVGVMKKVCETFCIQDWSLFA